MGRVVERRTQPHLNRAQADEPRDMEQTGAGLAVAERTGGTVAQTQVGARWGEAFKAFQTKQ